VYDMSCVQVLYSATYLDNKASDLGKCEAFPLLQHVGQRSVRAHVQDDVCACLEGKGAVESDDVRVCEF
jgi:hypothetical protein